MPARDAMLGEPGLHWHDYGKSRAPGPQARPLHHLVDSTARNARPAGF